MAGWVMPEWPRVVGTLSNVHISHDFWVPADDDMCFDIEPRREVDENGVPPPAGTAGRLCEVLVREFGDRRAQRCPRA